VLNDPFEAVALNGPDSHEAVCLRRYDFHFDDSEKSLERCAENLFRFCAKEGEAWFECWRSLEELVKSQHSPLGSEAKQALMRARAGRINQECIAKSHFLLPAIQQALGADSP